MMKRELGIVRERTRNDEGGARNDEEGLGMMKRGLGMVRERTRNDEEWAKNDVEWARNGEGADPEW